MLINDTIVALSTPQGSGALAVVRLSGQRCFAIMHQIFSGTDLATTASHTIHYGKIVGSDQQAVDEVVVAVYKNPRTYTGEDVVEVSCHGSSYIVTQIINLCCTHGARLATAGEFTQRAFLNGKLDLSQAEAVADLIASDNAAQHKLAWQQLRGGFSDELKVMREQLINFAALIELELDFSQEDVEFADRSALLALLKELTTRLQNLADSFKYGNAIKKGIPVSIVGKPNAGKSTLLNALLKEDKAIVSDIAGTTRDAIEDVMTIDGIAFRFIDTAGLRETSDTIEQIGIARSRQKIQEADIVLLLCDVAEDVKSIVDESAGLELRADQKLIILLNKVDSFVHGTCSAYDVEEAVATLCKQTCLAISSKSNLHLDALCALLSAHVKARATTSDIIVSNARHHQAIVKTLDSVQAIDTAMRSGISADLLTTDIRTALHTLGSITGQVEIDRDLLGTIFGKFCIGK
jgi:tRNA modification GTPase